MATVSSFFVSNVFAHPPTSTTKTLVRKTFDCVSFVNGEKAKLRLNASLNETTVIATQAKSRSFSVSGYEVSQDRVETVYFPNFILGTATEPVTESIAQELKSIQPEKLSSWRSDGRLTMPGNTVDSDGTMMAEFGFGFGQSMALDASYPSKLNFAFKNSGWISSTFNNPIRPDGVAVAVNVPFKTEVTITTRGNDLDLRLVLKGADASQFQSDYTFYKLKMLQNESEIVDLDFKCTLM